MDEEDDACEMIIEFTGDLSRQRQLVFRFESNSHLDGCGDKNRDNDTKIK